MKTLLWARLRYGASTYLKAAVLVALAVAAGVLAAEEQFEGALAGSVLAAGGILTLIRDMTVEISERRQILQAILPTSPVAVALARVLGTLLVQTGLALVAAVVLLVVAPLDGGVRPETLPLLAGHGAALFVLYWSYLSEEMNIALIGRRVLLVAANVVVVLVLFWLCLRVGFLEAWKGLDLASTLRIEAAALALGALAVTVHPLRRSHLVGVSPYTGLPRIWGGSG